MDKTLTKLEFQQELQSKVEFITETRLGKLMELAMPDFEVTHSDLEERANGMVYINPERLRGYVGLVSGELLAMFDAALIDVVYQDDDVPNP